MSDFYSTVEERFKDWNYCHPLFLYAFVRSMKPQTVVEVGCYRGLTACWIGRALQQNNSGKLICIDNWSLTEHVSRYGDPKAHAEDNLRACGVDQWVELRTGDSNDPAMWPDKVDIVYIDGWHSYLQCKADTKMAISRGALVIAIDDTENCVGPRMLTEELRSEVNRDGWDVMDLHSDNGLFLMVKRQEKRPITFSQELPYPNPGVDLRPLSLDAQAEHFIEAEQHTGVVYDGIFGKTQHA